MKNHVYIAKHDNNPWIYRPPGKNVVHEISRFEAFCRIKGILRKFKKELSGYEKEMSKNYHRMRFEACCRNASREINPFMARALYYKSRDTNEFNFWIRMMVQFDEFCKIYTK